MAGKTLSVLVLLLSLLFCGCAERNRSEEAASAVQEKYERGEYREAVLVAQKALSQGNNSARLHYYLGFSLLALGRDYESMRELEIAAAADPALGASAARELVEIARSDFDTGHRESAARKLVGAVRLSDEVRLGPLGFLAGDELYEAKEYGAAARCYEQALAASPDTVLAGGKMLRLGEIYVRLGEREKAEELYRRVLNRYPYGNNHTDAVWRLADLLLEEAERELELGNFESSLENAEAVLELHPGDVLEQRARYAAGRAYEGLLEYDKALEMYMEILNNDTGSSGGVVEKARRKMDSFKRAGIFE